MATSNQLSAAVRYPANIQAGDLLLLTCQGRRNTMAWTAANFTKSHDYTDPPWGPSGLRFELQYGWATGNESATNLTVRNSTGVNGWSCVLSAFRGGSGSGRPIDRLGGTWANDRALTMLAEPYNWAPEGLEGALVVHWFASSDDNNHGRPSHGTLGYGGDAYDTTVGTDHATSMLYHVGPIPEAGNRITMRQGSRGPDAYATMSVVFRGD